ncbi:ferritin family protein [Desulfuromonas sp.]|mgnify:CR=1 FL=1|uniref:ferritin family protein n=1 Tax=Desulfuromonas sp. TaxID=892 RepID=UPI0025C44EF4|nr:ferritin family protein [Desulfuromonas sp.]
MSRVSRREFICLTAALSFLCRFPALAAQGIAGGKAASFPETVKILKQAYRAEMVAHNHYLGYTGRAVTEGFPNIAYLFRAFAVSEAIHANNYARLLSTMEEAVGNVPAGVEVKDTRANLKTAAKKELEKIETTYPDFLQALEAEACDEAIVNCMYSWKSHRQHERKVREIDRYAGLFFGSVASEIEGLHFDFHVCGVCGSTIDEPPAVPCEICNKSRSHFRRVPRPAASG